MGRGIEGIDIFGHERDREDFLGRLNVTGESGRFERADEGTLFLIRQPRFDGLAVACTPAVQDQLRFKTILIDFKT